MKPLTILAESGLSPGDDYQKKRGIRISNYLSLILCSAVLITLAVRVLLFRHHANHPDYGNFLLGFILFGFPILLNRLYLTDISRLYLCYIPVIYLWNTYTDVMQQLPFIETSMYDGLRIHLLAVSVIPYLLFNRKSPVSLIVGILPTLISFVGFEYFLSLQNLNVELRGSVGEDYSLMYIRTLVSYAIINGGCYVFQEVIAQNDTYNQRLLKELNAQKEKIEIQNEELRQGQDRLNEINNYLEDLVEEKTENIRKQNETILKYAYTNAHYVRGPVARMLGLIQLSRMKTDLDYLWFFEKVEHEAKDIDGIINHISNDLHAIQEINRMEKDAAIIKRTPPSDTLPVSQKVPAI